MLIPNPKSDFQKHIKKPIKSAKTKKHDFCSVYSDRNFSPNQTKIFFSPIKYYIIILLREKKKKNNNATDFEKSSHRVAPFFPFFFSLSF